MALVANMPPEVLGPTPKNFHLGPNNFSIGHDNRMSVLTLDGVAPTTMQRDYVRWGSGREASAVPPAPASIVTKDDRYFNTRKSETRAEYEGYEDAPPPAAVDRNKLRATNFKMDSDLSKFREYDSTHKIDYDRKEVRDNRRVKNLMESHVPQGDVEKVKQHRTDYLDTFKPHDAAAHKPDRAPCLHFHITDTTRGDPRQHGYDTTQKDEFPMKGPVGRIPPFPAQRGGDIPEGDRGKERTRYSTMLESYGPHGEDAFNKGYEKSKAIAYCYATNYKERDGKKPDATTIMKESFLPQAFSHEIRKPILRNHSDCPEGDDDPCREQTRATTTNYRTYHGKIDMQKPRIVKGADIFTQSKVSFGDPAQYADFYDTSMKAEFESKRSPYKYIRSDLNTKSDLPLKYYPGPVNSSVYTATYPDPMAERMKVDPTAAENLRMTHIRMPLVGEQLFTTEHKEKYTRKGVVVNQYDRHGLQRSSLPIGTLNQSLHLDGIKRRGRFN